MANMGTLAGTLAIVVQRRAGERFDRVVDYASGGSRRLDGLPLVLYDHRSPAILNRESAQGAELMRLPGDRCERYLRLLHRERSPLVVLTNNQFRVVFGDLRVSEPISVDLPVPHGNRILLKLEHLAETSPTRSFYDRVYPLLFLRAKTYWYS